MTRTVSTLVAAATLAAVSIATFPVASAQAVGTGGFGTPAEQQGLIANICGTQLAPLGAAGCACLAERAMTELDQPQRDYLILSVVQPQAADRTDTARSQADLKVIASFISDAQTACSGAGAPAAAPAEPAADAGAGPAQ